MAVITESELKTRLSKGILAVRFIKVNGDLRDMECTTDPTIIPSAPEGTTTKTRIKPPTPYLVAAWDINARGWRSFYVDSIVEVRDSKALEEGRLHRHG